MVRTVEYLGSSEPSIGEIFVRFDLRRFSDRWVIERTDEQMIAEPPPRVPKR